MSAESEPYVASEAQKAPEIQVKEGRKKGVNGGLIGRPRKSDLQAKKKRGITGRPPGDAAILSEYKARMLNSPKSKKIIQTILNAALDPEHKHQAVAWKLVIDRIAPLAVFEGDVKRASTGNHIQITISGVPGVQIEGSDGFEPIGGSGVGAGEEPDEIEAEFEEIVEEPARQETQEASDEG